jgi:hypothetical protein
MLIKRLLPIIIGLIGLASLSSACSLETSRPADIAVEIDNSASATLTQLAGIVTTSQQAEAEQATATAFANPTPWSSVTPIPSNTPPVSVDNFTRVGPNNFPDDINPLTGLPVPNPALLDRRPLLAKIPNYPHNVRPQSGITLADHIYEYYLEWGLTRFIAVFYGNDAARFGPIRSAHLFDENLIRMYSAILVFNGADKRVFDYFEKRELDPNYFVVERFCPPLCRDESIETYNNLFGNTAQVHQLLRGAGLEDERKWLDGNFYSSAGGLDFEPGTDIFVNYSYANYAQWVYHEPSGRYTRYQGVVDNLDGASAKYDMHMDAYTGQALAAENVIILMVPHEFYLKSSDTEIFNMDMTGGGDAYLFRDGKMYPARWFRFMEKRPLAIIDLDGRPLALKPGVTFFQVMNSTSEVNTLESTWVFNFARPPDPED